MNITKKILVLTAYPKETIRSRLEQEVRQINDGLRRANAQEQFEVQSVWAIQLRDLRRAVEEYQPQIVHFCGQGKVAGILVEDQQDEAMFVPPEKLADLFEPLHATVEAVILNACYHESQAHAMNRQVPYVIGITSALPSKTALECVADFYEALGAGKSVEEAFQSMQPTFSPSQQTSPVLLKKYTPPLPVEERISAPIVPAAPEETVSEKDKTPQSRPSPTSSAPSACQSHHFLCYAEDGKILASQLYKTLYAAGIPVWFDQHEVDKTQADWPLKMLEALRTCESVLFVMTPQSVANYAECRGIWKRARSYKKPIVLLQGDVTATIPSELEGRQPIVLTGRDDAGMQELQQRLHWLTTPEGRLRQLQERLADAQRDLPNLTDPNQVLRTQQDIDALQRDILRQEEFIAHSEAVIRRTREEIARGLAAERQPKPPLTVQAGCVVINALPDTPPPYFQNRQTEIQQIRAFLQDAAKRLLIISGRAGIGKTALACQALKSLESGQLPGEPDSFPVVGMVYFSAVGSRKISFPYLFADLCQLLPSDKAQHLDELYRDPRIGTSQKMEALLAEIAGQRGSQGCVPLLLDNFETLLSPETGDITDAEINDALCAIMSAPPHPIKVILTTRRAPDGLAQFTPACQQNLHVDAGLESPFAENMLQTMDTDGSLGLRQADKSLLQTAQMRTCGIPRALEALVAILMADREATLTELLAGAEGLPPEQIVDVLVGEAFSHLDHMTQRIIQALAVFGRPVPPLAVNFLLESYAPGVDAAPILEQLMRMRLVHEEHGTYFVHQTDAAYALRRIPVAAETDAHFDFAANAALWHTRALFHRAADYFKQTRTPRQHWQRLSDLAPQLAGIEMCCAAEDYDTAAEVLTDIDFDYLLPWGHARLVIALRERLHEKISDAELKMINWGNLGLAYNSIGQVQTSITCYEHALQIACEAQNRHAEGALLSRLGLAYADLGQPTRTIEFYEQTLSITSEIGDRQIEGVWLSNLGSAYINAGQPARAIDYYQQALTIARELGDRQSEVIYLNNIGNAFADQNEFEPAIQAYQQTMQIADEIEFVQTQHYARGDLALVFLCTNDLPAAQNMAAAARQYPWAENNHNILTLSGIIAVRLGEFAQAQTDFQAAIAYADKLLSYSSQNYEALDANGLALCGLALCAARTATGSAEPMPSGHTFIEQAIAAFRSARQIISAQDARGVLTRLLRLFDALAVADTDGLLTPVREVIGQ